MMLITPMLVEIDAMFVRTPLLLQLSDYLTELLRHPAEAAVRPAEWMPLNYRRDAAGVAA